MNEFELREKIYKKDIREELMAAAAQLRKTEISETLEQDSELLDRLTENFLDLLIYVRWDLALDFLNDYFAE